MPSTTKEVIQVTQINIQKARLAQIELLNKLNKCNGPNLIFSPLTFIDFSSQIFLSFLGNCNYDQAKES